jgi:hypothetical protein
VRALLRGSRGLSSIKVNDVSTALGWGDVQSPSTTSPKIWTS